MADPVCRIPRRTLRKKTNTNKLYISHSRITVNRITLKLNMIIWNECEITFHRHTKGVQTDRIMRMGKALMMWNVGRGFGGRRKSDGQQIAYTGRQIVCAMFVRKVRARKPKWAHTCPTIQRLHISVECYSVFEWSFVLFFYVEEFGYPR